jgi:riboflavin synthase
MFTGLIQKIGTLDGLEARGGGMALAIRHPAWDTPLSAGESVAVQGVCLTVSDAEPGRFRCDVLEATLAQTSLGRQRPGAGMNLERALRPTDRFGGHFVSGHVDGVGTLAARRRAGPDWVLRIACAPELTQEMVARGSVACDGVSLTLRLVEERGFEVHIIPTTWRETALGALAEGDPVNVETDLLGKYVRRFLDRSAPACPAVTPESLRKAGFLEL